MNAANDSRFLPVLFKSLLLLLALSLFFLSIDIVSKHLVYTYIEPWDSIQVIGDFFRLTHVQNTLVAFGFLGSSQWYNFPLAILVIGTIVILFIVFQDKILAKIPPLQKVADYLVEEIGSLENNNETEEGTQEQKPVTIHKIMFPLFIAALTGNLDEITFDVLRPLRQAGFRGKFARLIQHLRREVDTGGPPGALLQQCLVQIAHAGADL